MLNVGSAKGIVWYLCYYYKAISHIRWCYIIIIHSMTTVQAITYLRWHFGIGLCVRWVIRGWGGGTSTCILLSKQPPSLNLESQNNKCSYWNGTHLLIWLRDDGYRQTFQKKVEQSHWASASGAFKSFKMLGSELTAAFINKDIFQCCFFGNVHKYPAGLLATDLSHELLGGEHQLVVDDPAWQLFKQWAVGVNVHSLLVLHSLVAAFG